MAITNAALVIIEAFAYFSCPTLSLLMTRNKMRVAIESGKGMKVKVVKLC